MFETNVNPFVRPRTDVSWAAQRASLARARCLFIALFFPCTSNPHLCFVLFSIWQLSMVPAHLVWTQCFWLLLGFKLI